MSKNENSADQIRRQHERHYQKYTSSEENQRHSSRWLQKDTVNAWYVHRLISAVDPLLDCFPDASWLTIGDGRFGNDAQYIQAHGSKALPTDISDTLLKAAKAKGFISEYRKENAEDLSFPDENFDFVLCKESFHHLPRPMLALYEMLRVARRGVILIEPNDGDFPVTAHGQLYRKLSKWMHKHILKRAWPEHSYEEVGNYVYSISRREITKVALGINLRAVAFKNINVHYLAGIEEEKVEDNGPLFKRIKRIVALRDWLNRLGLKPSVALAAIVFKEPLSDALELALRESEYEINHLPANPYIE